MSQAQKELIEIINPDSKGSPPAGYDRKGVKCFCRKISDWNQRMPSNISFDIQEGTKEEYPNNQKAIGIRDCPTDDSGLIPGKVEKYESSNSSYRSREVKGWFGTSSSDIVFTERKD